ncbi:MAG: hypothetical protein K1X53_02955 [Candidatus Sumerlaeaceae bacterium]|nr:hypothetical protein [Candidatus Sumerlaeaceae bacterium]
MKKAELRKGIFRETADASALSGGSGMDDAVEEILFGVSPGETEPQDDNGDKDDEN